MGLGVKLVAFYEKDNFKLKYRRLNYIQYLVFKYLAVLKVNGF